MENGVDLYEHSHHFIKILRFFFLIMILTQMFVPLLQRRFILEIHF